jgi:hypothetical protein
MENEITTARGHLLGYGRFLFKRAKRCGIGLRDPRSATIRFPEVAEVSGVGSFRSARLRKIIGYVPSDVLGVFANADELGRF